VWLSRARPALQARRQGRIAHSRGAGIIRRGTHQKAMPCCEDRVVRCFVRSAWRLASAVAAYHRVAANAPRTLVLSSRTRTCGGYPAGLRIRTPDSGRRPRPRCPPRTQTVQPRAASCRQKKAEKRPSDPVTPVTRVHPAPQPPGASGRVTTRPRRENPRAYRDQCICYPRGAIGYRPPKPPSPGTMTVAPRDHDSLMF